jgi:hypothetical protein
MQALCPKPPPPRSTWGGDVDAGAPAGSVNHPLLVELPRMGLMPGSMRTWRNGRGRCWQTREGGHSHIPVTGQASTPGDCGQHRSSIASGEGEGAHQRLYLGAWCGPEDPTDPHHRRGVREGAAGADEQPRTGCADAARCPLPHHRLLPSEPGLCAENERKLEEILQRFKDDWDALERELRKFIEELRQGDRNEFPDLDPRAQVPFVRLLLEECSKGRQLTEVQRSASIAATLDIVERIRQEVRKVGFWKNPAIRELLTRALVRDLDAAGICQPGTERDLAQRLVALAKENHENLTQP